MADDTILPFFDPRAREVPVEVLERLQGVADRWTDRVGKEEQLSQPFLEDLCRALGTPTPAESGLDHEDYQYEKRVQVPDSTRSGKIDLYKKHHFIIEAKCGRNDRKEPGSAAIRGTPSYAAYIENAYNLQARVYASLLPEGRPPVLMVVDVGHRFWIWRRSPDGEYPGFHAPQTITFKVADLALEENARVLWLAFTEPQALDPSRYQERVTQEVADLLAELAKPLQAREPAPRVARFLIQTLFCMFAEDVDLLPRGHFTELLTKAQFKPDLFAAKLTELFTVMRDGGVYGWDRIRRFNGALFKEPVSLTLKVSEIATLKQAASRNWAMVEPAIFGTLIERALDPVKRRQLGAHYTPRSFVERLVKPVVEDPLRTEWEVEIKPEAGALWRKAEEAEAARAAIDTTQAGWRDKAARLESDARVAQRDAIALLDEYHHRLTRMRVLDPACGTGNFLYVAYDVLKSLEFEVLAQRAVWAPHEVGAQALAMGATSVGSVAPHQLLGIEIEPFAAEIAQLTLWIGHLQWELRHRRKPEDLPEPIIPTVRTIDNRDALLTWEDRTPRTGEDGEPVTRWKMGAMKEATTHDGLVPDESVREPVFDYAGVSRAPWPEAEFIVGNPPFIGNKMMRERLGDGYVEALRDCYDDVPGSVDLVMYWWHRAALLARSGDVRRFGFITTNSLRQAFNRKVLDTHMRAKKHSARLVLAVPDHPWTDAGAAVRISMTAVEGEPEGASDAVSVYQIIREDSTTSTAEIQPIRVSHVHSDLSWGPDVTSVRPLVSNVGIAFTGMYPLGQGFILTAEEARTVKELDGPGDIDRVVRPFVIARDLSQTPRDVWAIDFFGHSVDDALRRFPNAMGIVVDRVKPQRMQVKRESRRKNWWLFAETVPSYRSAILGLDKVIMVPRTARYFSFRFVDAETIPDTSVVAIASDSPSVLAVLSSKIHEVWARATGGALGVGNDSRYSHRSTFNPFPFPHLDATTRVHLDDLGNRLDLHRKVIVERDQSNHYTNQYNALRDYRKSSSSDSKKHNHIALGTVVLSGLHDDLDRAVATAYGWEWPLDEQEILSRLVALNHERAREEAEGHVRWLRPDRAQEGAKGTAAKEVARAAKKTQIPWPKDRKAQRRQVFAAIDGATTPMTLAELAAGFKGAGVKRVGAIVEELEDLGFVVVGEDGAVRRG